MKTEITMLGTGFSNATKCYNTCFTISENDENHFSKDENIASKDGNSVRRRRHFLVDTGGGNYILRALELSGIELEDIHDIFITHAHNDHILGILWIISEITRHMRMRIYEGDLRIYCHDEAAHIITELARLTLFGRTFEEIGKRIKLIIVEDGDSHKIMNFDVKFCDIHSTKQKQFGFSLVDKRKKHIVCCGDEPMSEEMENIAKGCDILMHEAYCLYSERERYKPYKKHHSTAKDACENAARLGAKNIIMYHTEDNSLESRKADYTAEGREYFGGGIYVPDDGEIISLESGLKCLQKSRWPKGL